MPHITDPVENHIGRQFYYAIQNNQFHEAADLLTEMVRREFFIYPDNDLVIQVFMSAHIVSAFDLAGILRIEQLEPLEAILESELVRYHREYQQHSDPVSLLVHHIMQKISALCGVSSSSASGRMEQVKQYIDTFYSSPDLNVTDLSIRFDMSLSHLSRTFRQVTGQKLNDYIHEVRIRHAQELLAETDMPISQLALQVGYSSSNAFIRAYRNIEGVSPGTYRTRVRRLKAGQE